MKYFVQLQDDLYAAALEITALQGVNIVQFRKLRLQSEINLAALWETPRNGTSGAGILVEMPTIEVPRPNLPGPEHELKITFAVVEEPNMNLTPTVGTGLSAEEICERLLDTFHGYQIEGIGSLYADARAIEPANDFPNVVAYRVAFKLRSPRNQTQRVQLPSVSSANNGQVTLANVTDGATIYYTTDGSFPGPSNPTALQYSGTFDASSVQTVRWAAYLDGCDNSNVGQITQAN